MQIFMIWEVKLIFLPSSFNVFSMYPADFTLWVKLNKIGNLFQSEMEIYTTSRLKKPAQSVLFYSSVHRHFPIFSNFHVLDNLCYLLLSIMMIKINFGLRVLINSWFVRLLTKCCIFRNLANAEDFSGHLNEQTTSSIIINDPWISLDSQLFLFPESSRPPCACVRSFQVVR